MKPTDFARALTGFLTEYLAAQRNVSSNTIKAYRDTFTLVLRYCRDDLGLSPERVPLDRIDAALVLQCLDHLETKRACRASTRNHRIAVIRSFFRYVQIERPERMLKCQQILAIPQQRHARGTVDYLSVDDLQVILMQPDLSTVAGRRNAVLLSLLYDTGARVQELIDLSVRDLRLEAPAQARLTDKGRMTRVLPLMAATVALLREYQKEHTLGGPERLDWPLFSNQRGKRLSQSGIRHIHMRHVQSERTARPILPPRITPHTLRHYSASRTMPSDV